eukprot:COSAG01_NODE_12077_length_1804_cov_8.699947_2_plen_52_part_00
MQTCDVIAACLSTSNVHEEVTLDPRRGIWVRWSPASRAIPGNVAMRGADSG